MARRARYTRWKKAEKGAKHLDSMLGAGLKIGKAAYQGAKQAQRQSQRNTYQSTTPPSADAQACGGLVGFFVLSLFVAFMMKNWWMIPIITIIGAVICFAFAALSKPKNE